MKTPAQQIRDLLGPADPARGLDPVPPMPVHALITRAESAPEVIVPVRAGYPPAPRTVAGPRLARRSVLVGAAAGVAAVATGSVVAARTLLPGGGTEVSGLPLTDPRSSDVLAPLAFEFGADGGPAADRLRELADRLTPSASEGGAGTYTAVHGRAWRRTVIVASSDLPLPGTPGATSTPLPPSPGTPGATSTPFPTPPGTPGVTSTPLPPSPGTPGVTSTPLPPRTGSPANTVLSPHSAYPIQGDLPVETGLPPRTLLPLRTALPTLTEPRPSVPAVRPGLGPDSGIAHQTWSWYSPGSLVATEAGIRVEFVTVEARDAWYGTSPEPLSPDGMQIRSVPEEGRLHGPIGLTIDEIVSGLGAVDAPEAVTIAVALRQRGADRQDRARFLRALAGAQPQWVWRGAVVDRAGRAGVAISTPVAVSDALYPGWTGGEIVLVLDPVTGELTGAERIRTDGSLDEYRLFLETRHVAEPGQTW
ncbi:hypothetical protein ACIA8K_33090 [Catenuloplanes sp. NPDC051500]|uniref:hypothetical protein n=1 Tax=Catenuloplanes sp. NPDC051500 TaxID=3363959 RepID=UPI0037978BFA